MAKKKEEKKEDIKQDTEKKSKKTNNNEVKEKNEKIEKTEKTDKKEKAEKTEKKNNKTDKKDKKDKKDKENKVNKDKKVNKETEKKAEKEVEKKDKKQPDKKEENKKNKTQIQEATTKEIEEAVGKEIKAKKKLPSEEIIKINSRVFQNICLAVVIMLYLNFIILGFINIEKSVFITDLKVFSMAILLVSIGVFEYAYKKDSGRYTINGIEVLMLSFITMILIYINIMWEGKFVYISAFFTYVFAIYYVAKSIIIYKKMKKEYFLGEMKEIIKNK